MKCQCSPKCQWLFGEVKPSMLKKLLREKSCTLFLLLRVELRPVPVAEGRAECRLYMSLLLQLKGGAAAEGKGCTLFLVNDGGATLCILFLPTPIAQVRTITLLLLLREGGVASFLPTLAEGGAACCFYLYLPSAVEGGATLVPADTCC